LFENLILGRQRWLTNLVNDKDKDNHDNNKDKDNHDKDIIKIIIKLGGKEAQPNRRE
jgi:hypothetical protein